MENSSQTPEESPIIKKDFEFTNWIFAKAVIWVLGIMLLYTLAMYILNWDMGKRGQFGDMFGFLNTFFSGMAFFLLFITVAMQIIQISLQREEINDSKKEAHRQREIQTRKEEVSNENLRLQALGTFIQSNIYLHKFYSKQEKDIQLKIDLMARGENPAIFTKAKNDAFERIIEGTEELNEKLFDSDSDR